MLKVRSISHQPQLCFICSAAWAQTLVAHWELSLTEAMKLNDSPYFSCTEKAYATPTLSSGDKQGYIIKINDNKVKNMIQLPDQDQ